MYLSIAIERCVRVSQSAPAANLAALLWKMCVLHLHLPPWLAGTSGEEEDLTAAISVMTSTLRNRSSALSDFVGVWQRVAIYEPRGTLGPESDQKKVVLWIQSKHGIFIDIRFDPGYAYDPLLIKSFGGTTSFDSNCSHLTWQRDVDYRIMGTPDVGHITFTSDDTIEEDSVLPGDDFKELWRRIANCGESDFTATATVQGTNRKGYLLGVGPYFAFTLNRPMNAENRLSAEIEALFTQDPAESCQASAELLEHLQEYVTVVGLREDWKITHSLDPHMIGHSISSAACQHERLKALLSSVEWEIVDGIIPHELVHSS